MERKVDAPFKIVNVVSNIHTNGQNIFLITKILRQWLPWLVLVQCSGDTKSKMPFSKGKELFISTFRQAWRTFPWSYLTCLFFRMYFWKWGMLKNKLLLHRPHHTPSDLLHWMCGKMIPTTLKKARPLGSMSISSEPASVSSRNR